MSGLRIIAGTHRGRPLVSPSGQSTRPTSGRVREALFSILGDVSGLSVLDLYAGSGAMGLEALSRGAARAVFVEASKAAVACIRENLRVLELEQRARLLPVKVEAAKRTLSESDSFDLVICDPPWADLELAVRELEHWVIARCLVEGGRLVLEHPAKQAPRPLSGVTLEDQRAWGDTGISIFSR